MAVLFSQYIILPKRLHDIVYQNENSLQRNMKSIIEILISLIKIK
jgi:hypothetical protein